MGIYSFFRGMFGKGTSGYEVVDRVDTNQLPHTPRPQVASKELTNYNRQSIIGQSRYYYRNDGTIKELIDNLALYSIGRGITPQPMTTSSVTNKIISDQWAKWWKKPEITGRFTGRQIQEFISKSYDVDGEIFIIKTYDPQTE